MKSIVLLISSVLAGCSIGPRPETYPLAHQPRGPRGQVTTREKSYRGELLEVSDSAVLILAAEGIVQLSYEVINRLDFKPAPAVQWPDIEHFIRRNTQLRLMSRFPHGLAPDVLQRLLAAHGQPQLITVPPRAETDTTQFVARARAATAVYRERTQAVRAGYRRIGPDTPEMGEHWVHPFVLVTAGFDAGRPAVLTYITVRDTAVLTGVAYAMPLDKHQEPPALPAGMHWHDHSASPEAELAGGIMQQPGTTRVAMLHAWIWLENPAGTFVDENWSLPYHRLGMPVPARTDVDASRALSLLTEAGGYYADLIRSDDDAVRARVRRSLEQARTRVARLMADTTAPAESALAELWAMLRLELAAFVPDLPAAFGAAPHHHPAGRF